MGDRVIEHVNRSNKHQYIGRIVLVTLREYPHSTLIGWILPVVGADSMVRIKIVGIDNLHFPVYPEEITLLEVN